MSQQVSPAVMAVVVVVVVVVVGIIGFKVFRGSKPAPSTATAMRSGGSAGMSPMAMSGGHAGGGASGGASGGQ